MSNGSNVKYKDFGAFLKAAEKLAEAESKGALSRPEFYVQTAVATVEGAVTTDHAAEIWKAYSTKADEKAAAAGVVRSEAAFKVRVSELSQIILAATKQEEFPDLLNAAKPLIADMKAKGEYKGNTQDAFVAIARAQKKSDTVLTPDECREAIAPAKETKERSEVKELEKLIKQMKVVHDGTQGNEEKGTPPKEAFPSEQLAAAIAGLEERVGMLRFSASTGLELAKVAVILHHAKQ